MTINEMSGFAAKRVTSWLDQCQRWGGVSSSYILWTQNSRAGIEYRFRVPGQGLVLAQSRTLLNMSDHLLALNSNPTRLGNCT